MSSRVKKRFEAGGIASVLATFAVFATGCSGGGGSSTDAMPGVNCDIPELFQQRCGGSGCHGADSPSAGLDLASPGVAERISDRTAINSPGVIASPGRPEDSVLYDRVQSDPTTGARMPLGGNPLDDADVTCIRDWISGLLPPPPDRPDAGPDCPGCECPIGEMEACFSGSSDLDGVGRCQAGMRTCEATPTASQWGACTEEVLPQPERCDTPDIDEDCNGATPTCNETWSFALATAETNQSVRSVAVDSQDNVWIAGDFGGSMDLGGGVLTADSPDENIKDDVFLAKYDKNGNFLYGQRFGDTSTQNSTQVIVDASDNVILLGRAFGRIDFGGDILDAVGTDDIFVAKFRSDGSHVWSTILGGGSADRAERMAVDRDGDIWITGTFTDEASFGQTGPFQTTGIRDGIILEINGQSGAVRTAIPFGGGGVDGQGGKTGDNYGFGVDVFTDNSGAPTDFIYVTGYFSESMQIGNGPQLTSAGGKDVFVAKLDASGNHVWSKRFGSTGEDFAYDLVVDPSDGSAVVTGFFQNTIDFGGSAIPSQGSFDMFLAKLDASGDHVFSAGYGDSANQHDFGTFDTNTWTSLDLDADGDILLGGPLVGTAGFGPTPITSPEGRMDAFLVRFNKNGGHLFSTRYGDGGTQIALDIAATRSGHVLMVGRFFSSTLAFEPATGTVTGLGLKNGIGSGGDGFVARLVGQ